MTGNFNAFVRDFQLWSHEEMRLVMNLQPELRKDAENRWLGERCFADSPVGMQLGNHSYSLYLDVRRQETFRH